MTGTSDVGGIGDDRWSGVRAGLPALDVPGTGERLLVVAAHPDDETLGAGGLLAAADRAGAAITVVVATDGDASHPRSPTHRPRDLAHVRRREVYAALAVLAPSADVELLGLPDGLLAGREDQLTSQLLSAVQASTTVVTPWEHDRHPDHEACARAVAAALETVGGGRPHWQYPIWAWHWDDPGTPRFPRASLRSLPLDDEARDAKERALACFPSQCLPLSDQPGDEVVLAPAMLAHFRTGSEVFVLS